MKLWDLRVFQFILDIWNIGSFGYFVGSIGYFGYCFGSFGYFLGTIGCFGIDLESWVESPNKSFSVWVKNDGNTDTARIFNVGYQDTNQTGFALGIDDGTNNKPFYFLRDASGSPLRAEFGDVLNTTDWYQDRKSVV